MWLWRLYGKALRPQKAVIKYLWKVSRKMSCRLLKEDLLVFCAGPPSLFYKTYEKAFGSFLRIPFILLWEDPRVFYEMPSDLQRDDLPDLYEKIFEFYMWRPSRILWEELRALYVTTRVFYGKTIGCYIWRPSGHLWEHLEVLYANAFRFFYQKTFGFSMRRPSVLLW